MKAHMNCLNKSLAGARAGVGARLYAEVVFGIAGGGAGVPKSVLEELELLEWVDLLEPSLVRLLAKLWATALHRGP